MYKKAKYRNFPESALTVLKQLFPEASNGKLYTIRSVVFDPNYSLIDDSLLNELKTRLPNFNEYKKEYSALLLMMAKNHYYVNSNEYNKNYVIKINNSSEYYKALVKAGFLEEIKIGKVFADGDMQNVKLYYNPLAKKEKKKPYIIQEEKFKLVEEQKTSAPDISSYSFQTPAFTGDMLDDRLNQIIDILTNITSELKVLNSLNKEISEKTGLNFIPISEEKVEEKVEKEVEISSKENLPEEKILEENISASDTSNQEENKVETKKAPAKISSSNIPVKHIYTTPSVNKKEEMLVYLPALGYTPTSGFEKVPKINIDRREFPMTLDKIFDKVENGPSLKRLSVPLTLGYYQNFGKKKISYDEFRLIQLIVARMRPIDNLAKMNILMDKIVEKTKTELNCYRYVSKGTPVVRVCSITSKAIMDTNLSAPKILMKRAQFFLLAMMVKNIITREEYIYLNQKESCGSIPETDFLSIQKRVIENQSIQKKTPREFVRLNTFPDISLVREQNRFSSVKKPSSSINKKY